MVLFDTDIMIDFLREYQPALDFLESLSDDEIFIPGFVVMELIQGCRNKSEQKKLEKELMTLLKKSIFKISTTIYSYQNS